MIVGDRTFVCCFFVSTGGQQKHSLEKMYTTEDGHSAFSASPIYIAASVHTRVVGTHM